MRKLILMAALTMSAAIVQAQFPGVAAHGKGTQQAPARFADVPPELFLSFWQNGYIPVQA